MKTIIFIVLVAFATLVSCKSGNVNHNEEEEHEEHAAEGVVVLNEKQQKALNLKLGKFQMRNLTTVVKTNGQLEVPPASKADITAIIGGNVKEIKVFHGDKVRKGQILAILEHPDYITLQENYSISASRLDYLKQEHERQKKLFENNVGAGKDYQQVKSEYNVENARFEGLKSRLILLGLSPEKVKNSEISSTINIKSPINGFVNEVNIKVGTYVDAKDILFEVTDNSAIHADFMVYENDVHLIHNGQKVHFTVSNKPGLDLSATVFAIGKEFEPNTRAMHIHATINDQFSGLIPGMYISGHLHTDENYTRTLPNDAIVAEGTKSFIFVVDNVSLEEHRHDETNGHDGDEYKNHEEVANHDGGEEGHDHEGHNDEINDENNQKTFRMIEVILGKKDDRYTEIFLIDSLPENTQIVMNAAYYLLSDMNKEETEHEH